ncbi:MAG: hypothetical protein ACK2T4_10920 [Candidatus Promineifilaceae bacterium]|jgi:hypothetical protein
MAKHKIISLLTLLLLTLSSACSVIGETFSFETSPTPTAVRNVLATYQPPRKIPTPPNLPVVTPQPEPITIPTTILPPVVPTPSSAAPMASANLGDRFCCLRFTAGPYAQEAETFPAGTEIVYAIWDYKGLSPGDRIRRIWIRDNLIWITREEKWDWENYGAEGTVRDLSIFDYEGSGLESAEYRLQLYINDELQQDSSFVIPPP